MEDNHSIRGFKGFDKSLSCRGFKYEVGKTYDLKGEVECCKRGFHFCEYPLEVFDYYPPCASRFCQVEGGGSVDASKVDSKVATSHIHVLSEIDLNGLIDEGVKYILNKADCYGGKTINTGDYSISTRKTRYSVATNSGDSSAATNTSYQSAAINSGINSSATNSGKQSVATNSGDSSAATNTGYQSVATNSGYQSAATNTGTQSVATNSGYKSAATNSGDFSVSTNSGINSSAINTGDFSSATNSGSQSAAISTGAQSLATVQGNESVAIVTGKDSMACGALGSWIVLTERGDFDGEIIPIKEVKAFKVDGVNIKENVPYKLVDGQAVAVN